MFEIRRLRASSLAKIVTLISVVLYLLAGFLVIVLYGGIRRLLEVGPLASFSVFSLFLVWLAGTVAVVVASYITGLLVAGFYNLFAKWWGGLVIELAKKEPSVSVVPNEKKPAGKAPQDQRKG